MLHKRLSEFIVIVVYMTAQIKLYVVYYIHVCMYVCSYDYLFRLYIYICTFVYSRVKLYKYSVVMHDQ